MQRNRILNLFSGRTPSPFHNRMQEVSFSRGEVMGAAGQPIKTVIFPTSGLISVVVELQDGDRVEAGMIGREGALGGIVAFLRTHHLNDSIALVPGSAFSMHSRDFIEIADEHPPLRIAILEYEQFMLARAQQTAACNAKHTVKQRLASWLLQASENTGKNEIEVTQESIAEMLGVRRASLSTFASQLQERHLIRYRHGHICIADPEGLKHEACECCEVLRVGYEKLVHSEAV